VSEARLLLVDDDLPHLDALAERLTGDGFEIVKASSGKEALDQLDAAWPDLVILDLLMPEMDGQSLAARIKSRADLPILVLSAIAEAGSKADLIARYAEDYVTKPYDYAELLARIRRVLRRLRDQIPVEELALGDITLTPRRREATVRGRSVALSPTESRFLATLAASMPAAVSTGRSRPSAPPPHRPGRRIPAGSRGAAARHHLVAEALTDATDVRAPGPRTFAGAGHPLVPSGPKCTDSPIGRTLRPLHRYGRCKEAPLAS
jgi:DNA-binding response OmpR family regulator